MSIIGQRFVNLKSSPTLAITARAQALQKEGRDIVSLSAGESDFDTPSYVKEAIVRALEEGKIKYTPVTGLEELRKAIAQKFLRDNHIEYKPSEIIVATGAKQLIFNAFLVTLEPGDEVVMPAPYWVSYPDMVEMMGGVPVIVPCTQEHFYKMTPAQLQAALTPKTKWVILNSPSNPSGMVYTASEIKALMEVVRQHPKVCVLSDDIYEKIIFEETFATAAEVAPDLKERILTINGFSKSHAMTGLRLGYAGGPEWLIKVMGAAQSQSTSNPTSIVQYGALAALAADDTFLVKHRQAFLEKRDLVLKLLGETGKLTLTKPQGAFYILFGISKLISSSMPDDVAFTSYLLDQGVAVVPGSAFGAPDHIRISYAMDIASLEKACARINAAVNNLR